MDPAQSDELELAAEPTFVVCSRELAAIVEGALSGDGVQLMRVEPGQLAEVFDALMPSDSVVMVVDPGLAEAAAELEEVAPDWPAMRVALLAGLEPPAWARGDERFVKIPDPAPAVVTAFVAACVREAELAGRAVRLAAEREHLAREVKKLNSIGIALSGLRDPERLLEYILTTTREITGADAGSVYTTEVTPEGARVLRFTLAHNDSLELGPLTQFVLPINTKTLAGYVAATGEPINIADAYDINPDAPYSFNPSFDRKSGYHTRSLLVLPMRNQLDECIGVLQLINRKRRPGPIIDPIEDVIPFDEACHELSKSLASQAAVSLTNSQLYEGLERKIEELEQTQSQLVQAEKLASLGQLTAGVAHEINNPLAFTRNNTDLVRERVRSALLRMRARAWVESVEQGEPADHHDLLALLAADPQLEDDVADLRGELAETPEAERPALLRSFMGYVEESRRAQQGSVEELLAGVGELLDESLIGYGRVAEIVKGLRNFARLDEASFQTADIDEGIRHTLMILREPARGASVTLEADLGLERAHPCFPAKLNQVVLNLINNAIDASPKGAVVLVRTRETASGVEIEVVDNGHGISIENMSKIFDPFFTTKPVGKGTGLGLSISYRIIREHHGTIVVEANPAGGTIFRVQIPADLSAPEVTEDG